MKVERVEKEERKNWNSVTKKIGIKFSQLSCS